MAAPVPAANDATAVALRKLSEKVDRLSNTQPIAFESVLVEMHSVRHRLAAKRAFGRSDYEGALRQIDESLSWMPHQETFEIAMLICEEAAFKESVNDARIRYTLLGADYSNELLKDRPNDAQLRASGVALRKKAKSHFKQVLETRVLWEKLFNGNKKNRTGSATDRAILADSLLAGVWKDRTEEARKLYLENVFKGGYAGWEVEVRMAVSTLDTEHLGLMSATEREEIVQDVLQQMIAAHAKGDIKDKP